MKLLVAVALFITAAALTCVFIHLRNHTAARQKAALLALESEQIRRLQSEQERLAAELAQATNAPASSSSHEAELNQLRAQAASLRQQTNQLAKRSQSQSPLVSSTTAPVRDTHPPDYWQALHQAAGTKPVDARDIAMAAYVYAMDHGNHVPTNMDQVANYLAKTGRARPTTNRFELVFSGSLDQLKGIPQTSIAIVRDTQTWTTPDGKQARVYGMMGGVGQIVTSDDNFQAWEAEHVISAASK